MTSTEQSVCPVDGKPCPCPPNEQRDCEAASGRTEQSDSVRVHLVGGGYVRGSEGIEDVATELFTEGARFIRLTDPGDDRAKVVPIERVLYVEEEGGL